ncbi:DUF2269 domain-containing protein [Actinokineospora sp. 24-640]
MASSRKLALTVHITTSVGWLGAVLAFIPLAAAAQSDPDLTPVLRLAVWSTIVPLSLASLASGVVCSLITPWGLVRHYWVLIKLVLTVLATAVLLLYTQTLGTSRDLVHAVAAALVLVVTTALAVYKPAGRVYRT